MLQVAAERPDDLAVQVRLVELYAKAGNLYEAIKLNHQVLKKKPNLLSALFFATYQHLYLGDIAAGDAYLKRIELLAPARAYDDRYVFCIHAGDLACAEQSGARYLELLRTQDSPEAADKFEADYALSMGHPERSIEILESKTGEGLAFSSDTGTDFDILTLAIAYNMQGEIEKRDGYLANLEARINESLANGLWPKLVADDLAIIAAIRGDAELTAERLALAIDSDAAASAIEIDRYKAFDTVRDDPAVKLQRDRLKAREEALKERLQIEGAW